MQGSVASLIPNFALEIPYPQTQKKHGGRTGEKEKEKIMGSQLNASNCSGC